MYPVLFRIGDFEITSFGVLMAVGALVGIWIFGRELKRSGLPNDGVDAAAAGVIGGLIGAKLLWTLEFSREAPVTDLLFSRGGLSWFGGLIGGVGTGLWMLRRRQVPVVPALAAATPALAVGHAIGRIGCFMVGDDYGRAKGAIATAQSGCGGYNLVVGKRTKSDRTSAWNSVSIQIQDGKRGSSSGRKDGAA